jgi:hypothetical protein
MKLATVLLFALCIFALCTTGCVGIQDTYAPPDQRKPLNVEDPTPLKAFIKMNDSFASSHFIKDIGEDLQGGTWRWTQQHPTMMFIVPSTKGVKFVSDFAIPDLTFAQTGPVTITVTINGQVLDSTTYDKPGYQRIEKAVRESLLHAKTENIVTMDIDKLWVAPTDKATFGFILTNAGFIQ